MIENVVRALLIKKNAETNFFDNLPVSEEDDTNQDFLSMSQPSLIAELNARVAKLYSLNRNDLITLLATFESPLYKQEVQEESQRIINRFDELTVSDL